MFTKAIVKKPGLSMIQGITSADLGLPDYKQALIQHRGYVEALKQCGLEVTILDADEAYPDSTFIEDTALLTPHCAIVTNPGAASRRGEIVSVERELQRHYTKIEKVVSPGTAEAGDIMMVGSHFYIGLSKRTNQTGADQIIEIISRYGMSGSVIELKDVLHLKTGLAYLENNNLVACGEFLQEKEFQQFNIIAIPEDESYAANCVWINDKVLIPKGFEVAKQRIISAGYEVLEVDTSEFRKLDGGLSCLSLRF